MNFRQATNEEIGYIEDELEKFNKAKKPIQQEKDFVAFTHVVEDNGEIIGGIFGYASYYKIGYIDTLWVNELHRKSGIGSELLKLLEEDLKNFGCSIIHLETFDYQGPNFYKRNGYEEFGRLEYANAEVSEIFLKKTILCNRDI